MSNSEKSSLVSAWGATNMRNVSDRSMFVCGDTHFLSAKCAQGLRNGVQREEHHRHSRVQTCLTRGILLLAEIPRVRRRTHPHTRTPGAASPELWGPPRSVSPVLHSCDEKRNKMGEEKRRHQPVVRARSSAREQSGSVAHWPHASQMIHQNRVQSTTACLVHERVLVRNPVVIAY